MPGVTMPVPSAAVGPKRDMPSPSTADSVAKAVEGKQFPSPLVSVWVAKAMRRITMFVPKSMTTSNGMAVKAVMLTTMIVAPVIV